MFHVTYNRAADLLTLVVQGFWKPEDVPVFAAAVGAEALKASKASPHFNVLVESFDFPVQALDVADLLVSVMRGGMALTNGRAAVVVGSNLNKLQAGRTLNHPRVSIFMEFEDATRWLAASPHLLPLNAVSVAD